MVKRTSFVSLLVAIPAFTLIATATVHAAVPESLDEVLAQYNCRDVSADTKVSRFSDPWWVSLESVTGGISDYALYCEDREQRDSARLILVVRGDMNPWSECDPVVNSWRGEMRLPFRYSIRIASVVRESRQDLGGWWLVNSPEDEPVRFGAEGEKVSGPIVDTGTPAGAWYACHAGEWYRTGAD